jgi:hypothetical protein
MTSADTYGFIEEIALTSLVRFATGTARAAAAAATGATESVLFGVSHVFDLKGIDFQFVEFDG